MTISNLVPPGSSKNRPSVSAFFGKKNRPANDNIQKTSNIMGGDKFSVSMLHMFQQLNVELHHIEDTSNKTILAFKKITKDLRDVKKEMNDKFKIVNRDLDANRLDFLRSIKGLSKANGKTNEETGSGSIFGNLLDLGKPTKDDKNAPPKDPKDKKSWLDDILGGAGMVADIVSIVKWFSSPLGAILLGGVTTFAGFATAMFGVAAVADWVEEKLGLKQKYQARMQSQEYKDMQDTQEKASNSFRNANDPNRLDQVKKILDANKLSMNDIDNKATKEQKGVLVLKDGRKFDLKTGKPTDQTPDNFVEPAKGPNKITADPNASPPPDKDATGKNAPAKAPAGGTGLTEGNSTFIVAGIPAVEGKDLAPAQVTAIDNSLEKSPDNARLYPKWLIDQYTKIKETQQNAEKPKDTSAPNVNPGEGGGDSAAGGGGGGGSGGGGSGGGGGGGDNAGGGSGGGTAGGDNAAGSGGEEKGGAAGAGAGADAGGAGSAGGTEGGAGSEGGTKEGEGAPKGSVANTAPAVPGATPKSGDQPPEQGTVPPTSTPAPAANTTPGAPGTPEKKLTPEEENAKRLQEVGPEYQDAKAKQTAAQSEYQAFMEEQKKAGSAVTRKNTDWGETEEKFTDPELAKKQAELADAHNKTSNSVEKLQAEAQNRGLYGSNELPKDSLNNITRSSNNPNSLNWMTDMKPALESLKRDYGMSDKDLMEIGKGSVSDSKKTVNGETVTESKESWNNPQAIMDLYQQKVKEKLEAAKPSESAKTETPAPAPVPSGTPAASTPAPAPVPVPPPENNASHIELKKDESPAAPQAKSSDPVADMLAQEDKIRKDEQIRNENLKKANEPPGKPEGGPLQISQNSTLITPTPNALPGTPAAVQPTPPPSPTATPAPPPGAPAPVVTEPTGAPQKTPNKVELQPNGNKIITSPDGTVKTVSPDGEILDMKLGNSKPAGAPAAAPAGEPKKSKSIDQMMAEQEIAQKEADIENAKPKSEKKKLSMEEMLPGYKMNPVTGKLENQATKESEFPGKGSTEGAPAKAYTPSPESQKKLDEAAARQAQIEKELDAEGVKYQGSKSRNFIDAEGNLVSKEEAMASDLKKPAGAPEPAKAAPPAPAPMENPAPPPEKVSSSTMTSPALSNTSQSSSTGTGNSFATASASASASSITPDGSSSSGGQSQRSVSSSVQQTAPQPADLTPPPKGGAGGNPEPIVMNNNQSSSSQESGGGNGNTVGQNLPLSATNEWLQTFIEKQNIKYQ